jgi:hypothetical protein
LTQYQGSKGHSATFDTVVSDAKYMDELAFFGTSGKLCLVTYDPLNNSYPPGVSQVDPLYDEYPPDHYGSPVDGIDPTLDFPLNAHLSNGTENNSVSVSIGWWAASKSTQVGFSCSFSWT